jgi:hypothetical protein
MITIDRRCALHGTLLNTASSAQRPRRPHRRHWPHTSEFLGFTYGSPKDVRQASAPRFRIADSKDYSLDLSVAKAIADAPIESPSRSPRINATFSYPLN